MIIFNNRDLWVTRSPHVVMRIALQRNGQIFADTFVDNIINRIDRNLSLS